MPPRKRLGATKLDADLSADHTVVTDAQRAESEEEVPLEIIDYSCETPFEEQVSSVEKFLRTKGAAALEADKPCVLAHTYTSLPPGGTGEDEGFGRKVTVQLFVKCSRSSHTVVEVFNVETFLIISHDSTAYRIAESNHLLSTLCCSAEACRLPIPCFVPTGDIYRQTFLGRSHAGEFCTRYTMSAASSCPPQCASLSGILDLFHLNVGLQSRVPPDEAVLVDYVAQYAVDTFSQEDWEEVLMTENEHLTIRCHPSQSFGTYVDPIRSLLLDISWQKMDERNIVETTVRSSFDPYRNPTHVHLHVQPRRVSDYGKVGGGGIDDLIRILLSEPVTPQIQKTHGSPARSPASKAPTAPQIDDPNEPEFNESDEDYRETLLQAIFEPALKTQPKHIGADALHNAATTIYPPGSLFSRYAHQCCHLKSPLLLEPLWIAVVDELQALVDEGNYDWLEALGVAPSSAPNHSTCLVQQKLQMLMCCGEALKKQAAAQLGSAVKSGWDDDLDENEGTEGDDAAVSQKDWGSEPIESQTDRHLLSGRAMKCPAPQQPVPICSDIFEQQQASLASLGTSATGQNTRQWLQRGPLQADIATFKYLNRKENGSLDDVTFADFVRWHSPADFIESPTPSDIQEHGEVLSHVSLRMRDPSNMWQSLWAQVGPHPHMPAFNAAEELQLTLRWLRDIFVAQDGLQAKVWIIHYAFSGLVHRMSRHRLSTIPPCAEALRRLDSDLGKGLCKVEESMTDIDPDEAREVLPELHREHRHKLEKVEALLCAAISLEQRLQGAQTASTAVLEDLLTRLDVEDEDASPSALIPLSWWKDGGLAAEMVPASQSEVSADASGAAPPLSRKYLVRASVERPMNAPPSPQSLYVSRDEHDVFRIGLALSEALL